MKFLKKLLLVLCACVFLLSAAACGPKDPGGETPTGPGTGETPTGTVKDGTINIFLPIDSDSEMAFKNVGNAYAKMMKEKGITVRVNVRASSDPVGYYTSVDGLLKNPDKQDGDIIQANTVSQYFGTESLVDFTPYLNTANPYNDNKTWKTTLHEDAYRADNKSQKIYNLSMEGNAFVAFYNKATFAEYGIDVPTDWNSLISALDKLKSKGFTAPLGINFDTQGLKDNNFNWVLQMYMDQYFRDMIQDAHSQPGDYSRIPEIDDPWQYDVDDPLNDAASGYTYNFTRVVNSYFKDGSKYNTTSARFASLMGNMKKLASYGVATEPKKDPVYYSSTTTRQCFQQDAQPQSYEPNQRVAIYLSRLDYITDHQKSLGGILQKPNGVVPTDELSDMLGWFKLPAMPQGSGEGAPAADDLRTQGGPNHHPLALVNRDADKTALCIDFLKYLFSPTGFNEYYKHYKNLGKVCAMMCYLKDYELPAEVSIEGDTNFTGDCSTNPYMLFATCYTENTGLQAPSGNLQELVNAQILAYLQADGSAQWAEYGQAIHKLMTDSFTNYATWRQLKWTDLSSFTSASVNYATNPMNG